MSPFPKFAELPPATQAQTQKVYSTFHVTSSMIRYDNLTSALAIIATLYIIALYWVALQTGFVAALRNLCERIAKRSLYIQGALMYLFANVCLALAGLPLSFYRGYVIPRRFGLTSESVWQWQSDHWKAVLIDAVTGGLIAGLALVIIRSKPKTWPQLIAGVMTPIIAFGIFISPVVIDPLFNQFNLLSQSRPVWTNIHVLARRVGIGDAPIFIVDKSKQTNETNAYVTGLGPTLRIVIWDTTVKKMTTRELVAIIGHEMGHYVEGHLIIGFAMSVAALFALFPILRIFAMWLMEKQGHRWNLRGPLYDPAALVMLLLCIDLISLPVTPISNLASRWIEHRADAFSLGVVRDRVGLADAFVALSSQDFEIPDPPTWEKIWFDNHPPLGERIDFALHGQPND